MTSKKKVLHVNSGWFSNEMKRFSERFRQSFTHKLCPKRGQLSSAASRELRQKFVAQTWTPDLPLGYVGLAKSLEIRGGLQQTVVRIESIAGTVYDQFDKYLSKIFVSESEFFKVF